MICSFSLEGLSLEGPDVAKIAFITFNTCLSARKENNSTTVKEMSVSSAA